jgi:hypothetical protein
MYQFDDHVADQAVIHYTREYCDGELDEDFYIAASIDCYDDPALQICVVLDYLDAMTDCSRSIHAVDFRTKQAM